MFNELKVMLGNAATAAEAAPAPLDEGKSAEDEEDDQEEEEVEMDYHILRFLHLFLALHIPQKVQSK